MTPRIKCILQPTWRRIVTDLSVIALLVCSLSACAAQKQLFRNAGQIGSPNR